MKIRQNLLFLSTAALLSACGHYSEDLAALDKQLGPETQRSYAYNDAPGLNNIMTAAGGEMSAISFNEALAREYHTLAKSEQDAMDYQAAKMFTEKAKAALNGETVAPSPAITPEGQQRRAELVSALQTQMSPENYYSLAHAQVQYDSWQEQQDDGHKGTQINHCREGFEQAMAALVNPFAETRTYAVSFVSGQNTVSPDAQRVLNEIASFISEGGHNSYQLILSGTPEQLAPVHEKLIQMNFPATRLLAGKQPVAANTVQIDLRYAVPQSEDKPNI